MALTHFSQAHRAANAFTWPSASQMMAIAILRAEQQLESLIDARGADRKWRDRDADVEMTAELCLAHIRRMKHMDFGQACDFDAEWLRTRAALALATRAFSRPRSCYGKRLACALHLFDEGARSVEFVGGLGV
ncbi:MAG: hypothetical protein LBI66_10160 [Burkholderiaceae bacterium]|jgi:hypothetical protein|nr:hypothetical protein [Burkholderiaceae bacterium]